MAINSHSSFRHHFRKICLGQSSNQFIGGEIDFLLPPKLRFRGTVAEQWSCLYDLFNNGIEFKSFENGDLIFQVNE